MDQASGVVPQSHPREGAVELLHVPHGGRAPSGNVEQPSELTLRSHQAAYKAAKQGGSRKTYKRAQATLLETLKIHGLEGEYYYIIGLEKGPPPNKSETVPMEVCGKRETAAS